jgi:hypothetical protein
LGFTNVFRKQFTELFPHPSLLLSLSLKKKKRERREREELPGLFL